VVLELPYDAVVKSCVVHHVLVVRPGGLLEVDKPAAEMGENATTPEVCQD
jgi:hypothetical protein